MLEKAEGYNSDAIDADAAANGADGIKAKARIAWIAIVGDVDDADNNGAA